MWHKLGDQNGASSTLCVPRLDRSTVRATAMNKV
jgi:hypothetical protein